MKKVAILLLFLLLIPFILAEDNLYLQDSLQLQLDINGEFELVGTSTSSEIKEAKVHLLLTPQENFRQKIVFLESEGESKDNEISFIWTDKTLGVKEYGYSATIETNNLRKKVSKKITYPISEYELKNNKEYLEPTETIDSDNAAVIAKATELAEGDDDLFSVAFKLAEWVEKNVKYDLNTLTETASQKASWVLENKVGVCDEMTSLFIAMARSLGVPARFVSGISYSTSELFDENWQPHGWAEVYFPEIGWVSFDITFGEYGYVDVTHIKLRDGFDPQEPATKFEWLADKVDLEAYDLDLGVSILQEGSVVAEEIEIGLEVLAEEVGFGSYNLIKGVLKNTANYYAATTLQLSTPTEIYVLGRNKRTIMLEPKEVRETFWVVKVPENLKKNYVYNFPAVIYSEKNVSVVGNFGSKEESPTYSKSEIEKLTVKDEEKQYSRKIGFECDFPKKLGVDEEGKVECTIKNRGTKNLVDLKFCVGDVCEVINLPINQEENNEITVKGENVGWNKIVVSAENDEVEKKTSIEYAVLDKPAVKFSLDVPKSVQYGQGFAVKFNVDKESFAVPQDVKIILSGRGFDNVWTFEKLEKSEQFVFNIQSFPLSKENMFTLRAEWSDEESNNYVEDTEFMINGEAANFGEKVKMFFNRILSWMY